MQRLDLSISIEHWSCWKGDLLVPLALQLIRECMLQQNLNELTVRRNQILIPFEAIYTYIRLWTTILMVLWVISIGRTGGKVCQCAQSVQLGFGSAQQFPGRVTDERSEGCNSSCSPPCLTTRHHAEMKCQLISLVVSCCDSFFVNVWPRLFKHSHLFHF